MNSIVCISNNNKDKKKRKKKKTNDGRDMCIQRKYSKEDMEIYEEKAMRLLSLLV